MTPEQTATALQLEVKRLAADNAELRRKLEERNRHRQRVLQAATDARLLLLWRSGGTSTSAATANRLAGMSRRRWQNAVALLRMARLVDFAWKWDERAPDAAERAVVRATERAIASRDSFLMRLPKHGRPGTRRG